MHQQSSSPPENIQPPTSAATPDHGSLSISQDTHPVLSSNLDPPNEESKYTPGLWSSGGSTTVSLSSNQIGESTTVGSVLTRHFRANIDTKHTDIVLIICGFVGGLVDGLSFNAWGSFSSMQTGNTVFLALGPSGQPAYPAYLWAKSLIALSVFIASNVFFIHLHRILSPRRRSTMIVSFTIQTLALLVTAILIQLGVISPKPEDPRAPIEWMQVLPISLLAFQAGGQICASRILAIDEIPTVVLTTLLCDLLVDPKLTAKFNPKRNRRIGAFLALFLGAMTAGGLSKVTGMASSIWFAMGLKLAITLGWVVWKPEGRMKRNMDV
ncbi:hypothetical protein N7499_010264 [Penicillium canescens]|uniref:DUF1275 domain protein n=1 Tax=Penicillium canescens TaxID=5083 RepID=A0AAD6IHQ9_PENCN|nr:uncharacterized protein N7446_005415 [Penicillium canescens]KAJ5989734.1 hypothetical protein N7522_009941 [Penicillium canescens]KAJ6050345.1 hypothetical protein N7444_007061 [Penicillium canescens]KAJ6050792.1 hypothetical protein N7460_001326 [Penicillium canescens]KAJ6061295.1 hypothetical protein N7446_005415 [Penicillium canescens]KAJ6068377.1 hypothetical protein N7499_010264 [Penicillium canescens]